MVIAVLAGLVGSAAAISYLSWVTVFGSGIVLILLGLAVGVPTGFYYHVLLYRFLKPRGQLPSTWWINPSGLHRALQAEELVQIRRWFVAGACGFMASVLGCALLALGAFRAD